MQVNIFKGVKTGKIQIEPVEKGLVPAVLIPGEKYLDWIGTKEI